MWGQSKTRQNIEDRGLGLAVLNVSCNDFVMMCAAINHLPLFRICKCVRGGDVWLQCTDCVQGDRLWGRQMTVGCLGEDSGIYRVAGLQSEVVPSIFRFVSTSTHCHYHHVMRVVHHETSCCGNLQFEPPPLSRNLFSLLPDIIIVIIILSSVIF